MRKRKVLLNNKMTIKKIVISEVKKAIKKKKLIESINKSKKISDNNKRKLINKLLMEGKEDKKKVKEFVKFLDDNDVTYDDIKHEYNNVYSYDGIEYMILTDDEADNAVIDEIENVFDDMGLESFSKNFQREIINNYTDSSWFDEYMKSSSKSYAEDIQDESSEKFDNRLVEEMYEYDILTDDDFELDEDGDIDYQMLKDNIDTDDLIDEFVNKMNENYDDGIDWYIDNFGKEEMSDVAQKHGSFDYEAIAEVAANLDGRGHFLNPYDGDEEDSGKYYFYRQN